MATVHADSVSAPVKIRDLSSGGALIEGGALPHPGTKIRLVRGDLSISGRVVWSKGAKAGVQFDACAIVADWLPNARPRVQQARVDAIVHEFRTATPDTSSVSAQPASERVDAVELLRVKALLEALAEELADNPDVIVRHGAELQILDHVAQILGKLSRQMG